MSAASSLVALRGVGKDFANGTRAKLPRLPVEIGDHDFALRRQAPAIGEHTVEILGELGLAPTEIEALTKRGVIAVKAS